MSAIDSKKIELIKKKTRESIQDQDMVMPNEPEYSGDPKNTIGKDADEKELKNESRNKKQE